MATALIAISRDRTISLTMIIAKFLHVCNSVVQACARVLLPLADRIEWALVKVPSGTSIGGSTTKDGGTLYLHLRHSGKKYNRRKGTGNRVC